MLGPTRSVNWRLAAFIAVVAGGGLSVIAFGVADARQENLIALLALIALGSVGERLATELFGGCKVSIGMTTVLAAAALDGLWGIALVAPVVMTVAQLGTGGAWYKRLFNVGTYALTAAPMVGLLAVFNMEARERDWPAVLAPVAVGSLIAFAVNSGLVAAAIALHSGRSLGAVWQEKPRLLLPYYLLMGFGAIALATAYDLMGFWGIAVFALPVLVLSQVARQYATLVSDAKLAHASAPLKDAGYWMARAALDRVVALCNVRSPMGTEHGLRVAQLCRLVSERLGIEPESHRWVTLEHAALLHDLGLLLLPRKLFSKRGPLSEEEWTEVRRHPDLVHSILADDTTLQDVAKVIHAHHERFDGLGYPRGLAGEDIPLEARIFAVADAVDAMLVGRPYRSPLPLDATIAELERGEGSQFDPEVVSAFRQALTSRPNSAEGSLRSYPLAS